MSLFRFHITSSFVAIARSFVGRNFFCYIIRGVLREFFSIGPLLCQAAIIFLGWKTRQKRGTEGGRGSRPMLFDGSGFCRKSFLSLRDLHCEGLRDSLRQRISSNRQTWGEEE